MIVVDFETTDLTQPDTDPATQPGIVQIGLVELDETWAVTDTWEYLVNPEKPITEGAFKTHGISDEKVIRAPTLVALLPDLSHIFRRHSTWVGFNNSFDRTVLWYQLLRYNWQQRFPWPSNDIDIMKIGRDVANIAGKRDVKFPKLTELHLALFGVGFESAHNALADCMATAKCGAALYEKGML